MSAQDKAGFAEFLAQAEEPALDSQEGDSYDGGEQTRMEASPMQMTQLAAAFEDRFSPEAVSQMLYAMMPAALRTRRVRVRVEMLPEEEAAQDAL